MPWFLRFLRILGTFQGLALCSIWEFEKLVEKLVQSGSFVAVCCLW